MTQRTVTLTLTADANALREQCCRNLQDIACDEHKRAVYARGAWALTYFSSTYLKEALQHQQASAVTSLAERMLRGVE